MEFSRNQTPAKTHFTHSQSTAENPGMVAHHQFISQFPFLASSASDFGTPTISGTVTAFNFRKAYLVVSASRFLIKSAAGHQPPPLSVRLSESEHPEGVRACVRAWRFSTVMSPLYSVQNRGYGSSIPSTRVYTTESSRTRTASSRQILSTTMGSATDGSYSHF
jgi:hypothetical protein